MRISNYDLVTLKELNNYTEEASKYYVNLVDIINACPGGDLTPSAEIMRQFPLATDLLSTPFANTLKSNNSFYKYSANNYKLRIPRLASASTPTKAEGDCCFVSGEFSAPPIEVDAKNICYKNCESLSDRMMSRFITANNSLNGLATKGENEEIITERVNRATFAFLTAKHIVRGLSAVETTTIGSFNGLYQLYTDSSVLNVSASGGVIPALDEINCRALAVGATFVGYCNPITYATVLSAFKQNQYGVRPEGFREDNDTIYYFNLVIKKTKEIDVNLTANTGAIYFFDRANVGALLSYDMLNPYTEVIGDGSTLATDGCGTKCKVYSTNGAVATNDYNKVAQISGIDLTSVCGGAIENIDNLINVNSIMPR